jgi:hypothetical protein
MRFLRTLLAMLVLVNALSACVFVGRPHPYYWHPCYRCY